MDYGNADRQLKIWKQLVKAQGAGRKKLSRKNAVYIDGIRYRSYFEAGIDSGVSYVSISTRLKESGGSPVVIGYSVAVTENWIFQHPEYLFSF